LQILIYNLQVFYFKLKRCNPWPYVAHHSRVSRAYCAHSPRTHYDIILIMTSFTSRAYGA